MRREVENEDRVVNQREAELKNLEISTHLLLQKMRKYAWKRILSMWPSDYLVRLVRISHLSRTGSCLSVFFCKQKSDSEGSSENIRALVPVTGCGLSWGKGLQGPGRQIGFKGRGAGTFRDFGACGLALPYVLGLYFHALVLWFLSCQSRWALEWLGLCPAEP